jgi:hypothetical protein
MDLLRDALSNEETKAAAMLLRFFVAIPLLVVREILPFRVWLPYLPLLPIFRTL